MGIAGVRRLIKIQAKSKQDAFSKAYNGIMEQGCGGVNEAGNCSYRTEEGYKCGIGHLISDADYDSRIEDCGIGGMVDNTDLVNDHIKIDTHLTSSFLSGLQSCHDRAVRAAVTSESGFLKEFEYQMGEFAKINNLEIPNVK